MCETTPKKAYGWKGWSDLPAPRIESGSGPWIDLSHRITETLSRIPFFPQPVIRQIATDPVRLTEIHWGVLIAEHLTNLTPLAGRRAEIMFLGINIAGSDGAPARPVARAAD